MNDPNASPEVMEALQRDTFNYFVHEANPANGLVIDKTKPGTPASIAAVGLALSSYPVGVERGFMTRADAIRRIIATLRFFHNSVQSTDQDATGYKGFYYHFLDMNSGKRVWKCELSTIDTAILLAGMLTVAAYFSGSTADEREIGELGYDEALFLYLLGLGSPTHPLPKESYVKWASTYQWREIYGYEFLYSGPLFTHQISHLWIDFRGIQDDYMRGKKIDYFENSRRATRVQQQYAIDNPLKFDGYSAKCWGITASDGPGPAKRTIKGQEREFFDYIARSVPDGPDDGSVAPWAVVASLPFAPEIVIPTLDYFKKLKLRANNPYGFKATFNTTFTERSDPSHSWVSPFHYGLNQGPIVLMIENYRSGLLWHLMRQCPYLVAGLRRVGFSGGWLGT
jgi:hypothetical protein